MPLALDYGTRARDTLPPDAEEVFVTSLHPKGHEGGIDSFRGQARRLDQAFAQHPEPELKPLGQILIENALITPADLLKAAVIRRREQLPLESILLAKGLVREADLIDALCIRHRTTLADLGETPPDARLLDLVGPAFCLANNLVPWQRVGNITFIATASPEGFANRLPHLTDLFGAVRMVMATTKEIEKAVLTMRSEAMIHFAETSVDQQMSARKRNPFLLWGIGAVICAVLVTGLAISTALTVGILTYFATFVLLANMGLRLTGFLANIKLRRTPLPAMDISTRSAEDFPVISVMVPLYREGNIAPRLISRLSKLQYPRASTDILLVIEESDALTRDALARTILPHWIRVITVPNGPLRTKPRALNYALNFCRGGIIGVWDAEDEPEPRQLLKVAEKFRKADKDVACVQGILDFYNPRTNWLARCFTIEYASQFRGFLPGIASLGLVVPLGGTTVFFRREHLEKVGGWDAWNVTEDADLGMRLARFGLRTEMLDAVTYEEANCHAVPWIKQRSRWLKGFFITWSVHMRNPVRLWRQIGTAPFLAFQIQMLGGVLGFLLAPLLWVCWLIAAGLQHPVSMIGPASVGNGLLMMIGLFLLAEVINITIGLSTTSAKERRHLLKWVPSCYFYYPLGFFAGWKAIYEVFLKPFYWDKTMHGIYDRCDSLPPAPSAAGEIVTMPLHELPARSKNPAYFQERQSAKVEIIGHIS